MRARWLKDSDRPAVEAALYRSRDRLTAAEREWSSLIETDATVMLNRMLTEFAIVIVGDYLVAFQIIEGWLMPGSKFFQEVLVMRLTQNTGNSLRSVVSEMERIARANDCVGIRVGTFGADDDRLGRVYQRLGFRESPPQLYKEIQWAE